MIQVNTKEQLGTLFKIFKDNPYVILISVIAFISLIILLIANKFKNKKITKILCILVYIGIFGTLLWFYHNEIFKLLDYLMNNIFLFLFFPNLAVYALVLIVINCIIIKSTFSNKENKLTRNVNIIFFILFNIIFYLIIDNVIKNKINVYEQLSIYTNNDLLILVELSMKLFLCWLVILLIIKITSKLIDKIHFKRTINNNLNLDLIINEKELKNIETKKEISEIYPNINIQEPILEMNSNKIENEYNIYNDYIDIEPIKKRTIKLVEPIIEQEIVSDSILNQEEIKEVVELNKIDILKDKVIEEEQIVEVKQENKDILKSGYQGEIFESFSLVDFENNNDCLNINDKSYNKDLNKKGFDNNLVLENEISDDYFNLEYFKNKIADDNMDLIFNNKNNYLKNIIIDIEKLKDNQDDKNQIQKIYEEIKFNQKDLTLKDYNYLIEMLLNVKK